MKTYDILTDIHALEEELLDFERKYGIRSETFYAAYISDEFPAVFLNRNHRHLMCCSLFCFPVML